MKVAVKRDKFDKAKADVLIVPVYQDAPLDTTAAVAQLDQSLDGLVGDYLDSRDFSGALNSTALLRTRGRITAPRVLLVGVGKPDTVTVDHWRQASASAATTAQKLGVGSIAMLLPTSELDLVTQGQAITEGALLGLYTLKTYKTVEAGDDKAQLSDLYLLASGGSAQQKLNQGVKRGETIAKAVSLARDLSNKPGQRHQPLLLGQHGPRDCQADLSQVQNHVA